MLLEEKFDQIASGGFTDFRAVPLDDDIREIHSFGRSLDPTGYFFEQQSQLSSPWITNPQTDKCRFIGAHSYMNAGGYLRGSVLIGRYCSIGRRVTIGAAPHELDALSTSPRVLGRACTPYTDRERARLHQPTARRAVTRIRSDVWIGDGAVIMPGVTLAVGAVIGANAVVTHDIAPYEIVGGVPARTIGHRFDDDTVRTLLASQWWECDSAAINALPTGNIFEFLAAIAKDSPEPFAFPTWKITQPEG